MATAKQVKELIKNHYKKDSEQFDVIVSQILAHEKKLGHNNNVRDIEKILSNRKANDINTVQLNKNNYLLNLNQKEFRIENLILGKINKDKIKNIISEYEKRDFLLENGFNNANKILLEGPPGTGKTTTAMAIATELELPLYIAKHSYLIDSYLGGTSKNISKIFNDIRNYRGVYLFDEFDALGAKRGNNSDVAEMNRITNVILQELDNLDSPNIILFATNRVDILDNALERRFDETIQYDYLRNLEDIDKLIKSTNIDFKDDVNENMLKKLSSFSPAEIVDIVKKVKKKEILYGEKANNGALMKEVENREK